MYPVIYEADFNPAPNRWTTFFRPILAIPWLIVAAFWGLLLIFTHLFAWISIIVLGRYPEWLFNFNSGVVRFLVRVVAWSYLQTDAWPTFGLSEDSTYPVRVKIAPRPERQSRLKALFRLILVLPIAVVVTYGSRFALLGFFVVAWLTIVFRGYMPRAVHNGLAYVNGLDTRMYGYIAFLTDEYPPVGEERAGNTSPAAASDSPPTPPAPQAT
jgi:hypothetical protein